MTRPGPDMRAAPGEAGRDVSGVSVAELVGEVTQDLSTLMRQELELAKAEVKQEAVKTGKAAGMLGGAGLAGYMTLLFASIALWWGLANVMDQGWAALIVTGIWALIGAVLFMVGRRRLQQVHPTPERTAETVKELPGTLTEPVRRNL
jgi:Putative Actinobacterial Holin-X, holin superfamily III